MSKIGKKPITIPENIVVTINDDLIVISGPKGKLEKKVHPLIGIKKTDGQILVTVKNNKVKNNKAKALHGLTRSLLSNMVQGVTEGFSKFLKLHGVGFRASKEGEGLKIMVGFSHPVVVPPITGINFEVEENRLIKISGLDKDLVGQVTDRIRNIKKPDAYKGKGIRYKGEKIKLKPGKAAKVGAAAA